MLVMRPNSDITTGEELCPSCGKWALMHEVTGWCFECSGIAPPCYCERCGKRTINRYCNSCRYMLWLERNADEIERVMCSVGISAGRAKLIVRAENRPKCLCCRRPIKGGERGKNYFCRKTPACKTGHNSYHYHRTTRRRSRDEALRLALIAAVEAKLVASVSVV